MTSPEPFTHQLPHPQTRVLAESAPDPIITIDESSTILYANASAQRVFGYSVDELVGSSLLLLMPERMQALHTNGIARYIATGERSASWQGFRVPIRTKSGVEIPVEISFGEFEWNGARLFSGFLRDISERVASDAALAAANERLSEQAVEQEQQFDEALLLGEELAGRNEDAESRARQEARDADRARRLLELSSGLNGAVGASEVANLILDIGMPAVGADAGSFSIITDASDRRSEFEVISIRGFEQEVTSKYARFPLHPGRPVSDAVLTGAPVFVESRSAALERYPSVADVGYEAFVGIPVMTQGRSVAAIAFSFAKPQQFDEPTQTFLRTVGEQCAQALERARLYDDRNRAAERSTFLADASRLLSSSLDYEVTLNLLAESAVPAVGDWCAVDIIADPTLSEWPPVRNRLAVVHKDPTKKALGLSLEQRFPTDWNAPSGSAAVLRDAKVEFIPVITDEMLVAAARSAEHLALLRELEFSSVIVVPLVARGLILGALTLVMSDSGRHYTEDDVSLVKDLAGRAGIAIDNARLYRDAQLARTAAELAQARAAAASRAKSNFLATMSHEIRTPINAVLGYSELLTLELAGPLTEEQRTQLARIRASTSHLLTLVNEMLDLAKIESGTLRVDTAEVVAGDSANAALFLVAPQALAKGISISERCEGAHDARYLGDEGRVRQILANLIGNAVKFTKPGGSITLTCALVTEAPAGDILLPGREYVTFSVSDTGIGIAQDQLESIFDAFVQAESEEGSPYTRQQTGTGLGLAISRQLAHRMSGEITVQSSVNEGSTFTLYLPASPGGRADAAR